MKSSPSLLSFLRTSRASLGLVLLPALVVLLNFVSGCKSLETTENESARPWNSPRQWETGIPGFNQERR